MTVQFNITPASTSSEYIEQAKQSLKTSVTIAVKVGDSTFVGSGIIIDISDYENIYSANSTYILTAFHVLDFLVDDPTNAPSALLSFSNNNIVKIFNSHIIYTDRSKDLMLLQINKLDKDIKGAKVASKCSIGESAVQVGFTTGIDFDSINTCTIKDYNFISPGDYFTLTPSIFTNSNETGPGNSGGPLSNIKNDILGIASYGFGSDAFGTFSIPYYTINNFLSYGNINYNKNGPPLQTVEGTILDFSTHVEGANLDFIIPNSIYFYDELSLFPYTYRSGLIYVYSNGYMIILESLKINNTDNMSKVGIREDNSILPKLWYSNKSTNSNVYGNFTLLIDINNTLSFTDRQIPIKKVNSGDIRPFDDGSSPDPINNIIRGNIKYDMEKVNKVKNILKEKAKSMKE